MILKLIACAMVVLVAAVVGYSAGTKNAERLFLHIVISGGFVLNGQKYTVSAESESQQKVAESAERNFHA